MLTYAEAREKIGNVYGLVWGSELEALYNLVIDGPDNPLVVEIGSHYGLSSCYLALAAAQKGGRLICIDQFQDFDNRGYGPEVIKEFKKNVTARFDNVELVIAASNEAVDKVPAGIDLIFIDGGHSETQVQDDCFNYLPKVKPGGLVAFHDYNNYGALPGVKDGADPFITGWEQVISVWDTKVVRKPL